MTDFFFKSWVEFFFFVVMVVGLIVALLAPSAFISYLVVFLSGMIGGRLWYERKKKIAFPYYIILIGFLIGYLMGTYVGYGNTAVVIILFVLGILFSYHLCNKGYIRDLPF